jgi:phosphate transport system substrate-binding protein
MHTSRIRQFAVGSASAIALAVGIAAGATPAQAQLTGATKIYGGGASLSAIIYRKLFNCYGQDLDIPGGAFTSPQCVTPPNVSGVFTYASVGSGAGLSAFIFDDPTRIGLVPGSVTVPYANRNQTGAPVGPVPTFNYNLISRTAAPTGFPNHHFSGSDATIPQTTTSTSSTTRQRTFDCYEGKPIDPACTVDRRTIAGPAIQVPTLSTTINLPYRVGTVGNLRLSRVTLCGIFTGTITNWNHPQITADNGGSVTGGTSRPIRVVTRADGSGTTFLFTQHLNAVCDGTGGKALFTGGTTTLVGSEWTRPFFYRAPGNEGVAQVVAATPWSIGYTTPELTRPAVTTISAPSTFTVTDGVGANPLTVTAGTYTARNRAFVQNRAGAFLIPTPANGRNAMATASPPTGAARLDPAAWGVAGVVPDPTGATSYPIAGFTFLNAYTCYQFTPVASRLRGFFDWYTNLANTQITNILTAEFYGRLPSNWNSAVRSLVVTGASTKISGVTEAGRAPICTGKVGA